MNLGFWVRNISAQIVNFTKFDGIRQNKITQQMNSLVKANSHRHHGRHDTDRMVWRRESVLFQLWFSSNSFS